MHSCSRQCKCTPAFLILQHIAIMLMLVYLIVAPNFFTSGCASLIPEPRWHNLSLPKHLSLGKQLCML